MSTSSETEYADDQEERSRRSASPSPEARQTPIRDREELFLTSPRELFPMLSSKELFPVSPKELFPVVEIKELFSTTIKFFPQQTRELFPHERVFKPSTTPRKGLVPPMKGRNTKADREGLAQAARWELEVSAPGDQKEKLREHRRQTPDNQSSQKKPTHKGRRAQEEASGARGKGNYDLFQDHGSSINSTPYLERQKAGHSKNRPTVSSSSLLSPSSRPLEQRSTKDSDRNMMDTPSKTTSSRMKEYTPQHKPKTTSTLNSIQDSNLPQRRDIISPGKQRHRPDNKLSTSTTALRASPELALETSWNNLSTPRSERLSSPEAKSPQTSSPEPTPRKRPETNDFVARRMISNALGVRIPKRDDDRSIEIAKEMREKRLSNRKGDGWVARNLVDSKKDENQKPVLRSEGSKKEEVDEGSLVDVRNGWDGHNEEAGWW